jgi:hypothetical protein
MRSLCIEKISHYAIHWMSSIIIIAGAVINMFTLEANRQDSSLNNFRYYSFMLVLSVVFDVVSHTIKEAIVRS